MSTGVTPGGRDANFFAVTIISAISLPVTVTRRIAESPPTFTVWQTGGPSRGTTGVDDNMGRISSSPPSPAAEKNEGVGEGVGVEVGAGVAVEVGMGVGSGDEVGFGDGEGVGAGVSVGVGVGVDVGMGVGSGEDAGVGAGDGVGSGVTGRVSTVTYPARLSVLVTEPFRIVRFTV
jgi:hypothetical protein